MPKSIRVVWYSVSLIRKWCLDGKTRRMPEAQETPLTILDAANFETQSNKIKSKRI